MKILGVVTFVAATLLFGCATTKMAGADQDKAAKAFVPDPGTASLYVVRKSESTGSMFGFKLTVDGKDQGNLAPGTYQWVPLASGPHKVEVNTGMNGTSLTVDVVAGKNYFLQAEHKDGGPVNEPELSIVLVEPMGRLLVSQFSRAAGPQ